MDVGSDRKMQTLILFVTVSMFVFIAASSYNFHNVSLIGMISMVFFTFLAFIYYLSYSMDY
jgi:hypothetical protein